MGHCGVRHALSYAIGQPLRGHGLLPASGPRTPSPCGSVRIGSVCASVWCGSCERASLYTSEDLRSTENLVLPYEIPTDGTQRKRRDDKLPRTIGGAMPSTGSFCSFFA